MGTNRFLCSLLASLVCAGLLACSGDEGSTPSFDVDSSTISPMCTDNRIANDIFGGSNPVDRFELELNVPGGLHSVMFAAWGGEGTSVIIERIVTPSGEVMDFFNDAELREFHPTTRYQLAGVPLEVDRLIIPPLAEYERLLEEGTYTLWIDTFQPEVCAYAITASEPETVLELNYYFVGVPDLTADSAGSNDDWIEVQGLLAAFFAQYGIEVRTESATLQDIEATERFAIIRDFDAFTDLTRRSSTPSNSYDDALRLNVFLNRGFAGQMQGILGVSTGIPGLAGIHGTPDSGIVFGVEEYLGAADGGNELLAEIMAHEIGHFLGLFHTSETFDDDWDPLESTPECERASRRRRSMTS